MIIYGTDTEDISIEQLEGFFVGWRSPLTKRQHYNILRNSNYIVLAYDTEKSRVVGFINALSDNISFAFIPMLEVLPEYQNRGIGTELMKRMLELLGTIDCIDLTCDVEMHGFYERFDMLRSTGMVIRKYIK